MATTTTSLTHDQRGVEGVPYGFVYINDHTRVAYTGADGVLTIHRGAAGGWDEPNETQLQTAVSYLRRTFNRRRVNRWHVNVIP